MSPTWLTMPEGILSCLLCLKSPFRAPKSQSTRRVIQHAVTKISNHIPRLSQEKLNVSRGPDLQGISGETWRTLRMNLGKSFKILCTVNGAPKYNGYGHSNNIFKRWQEYWTEKRKITVCVNRVEIYTIIDLKWTPCYKGHRITQAGY